MIIAKVNLRSGKHKYFSAQDLEIHNQEIVIVEIPPHQEIGKVTKIVSVPEEKKYQTNLEKILRRCTEDDFKTLEKNKDFEKNAKDIAQERITYYGLNMNLKEVKSYFDRSKVVFYFLSEGRVDFRELVRDMAGALKTRIEMHQIGVRDEAKKISGIGPCGYKLCCHNFLSSFEPVTLKMARDQNLSLSPSKISGVCGRLLCCLKYEYDNYQKVKRALPQEGASVLTERGEGKIVEINVPREMLLVEFEDKTRTLFPPDKVKVISTQN